MTVLVESKQVKVTQALRDFATHQMEKLSKLGKRVQKISVFLETVGKKNNDPSANRVTVQVEVPGKNVIVRKHAADMYEAIVEAAHGAVRRLRKQTERRITLRRTKSVAA